MDVARSVDRYLTEMARRTAETRDWTIRQLHESAIELAVGHVMKARLRLLKDLELAALYQLLRYPTRNKDDFESAVEQPWPDLYTATPARFLVRRTKGLPEPIAALKTLGADFVFESVSGSEPHKTATRLMGRLIQRYEPPSFMMPAVSSDTTTGQSEDTENTGPDVEALRAQLAATTDTEERGELLTQFGEQLISRAHHMLFSGGELSAIEALLREAEQLLADHPDPRHRARLHTAFFRLRYRQGKLDQALDSAEQALVIRQEIGDRKGEGRTLNNISQIFKSRGDYGTALKYLKDSLAIQQEIGDKSGGGTTLNNMATIAHWRGDYETALKYLKDSLAIQQEIGDNPGLCATLFNIGHIHAQKQEMNEAMNAWTTDYKIADRLKLAEALQALKDLAPSVGVEGGLDGWAALAAQTDTSE